MKRLLLLFLFFASFVGRTICQVVYPEPLQLPSMEAQSLGEFAEIPADLHTGRVNIDIPIYVVKYGDVELPISISYHGGGVRVTDECGAVGLGWTLNAGGVINHIVRGMPDDLSDSGWKIYGYDRLRASAVLTNGLTGSGFLSFLNMVRNNNLETSPEPMLLGVDDLERTSCFEQYGTAYDEGHFDASPDNYQFSVKNLSGAFAYNGTNIICQTNDNCRIIKNQDGYEVTDNMGIHYGFQEEEYQIYPYQFWYSWEERNEGIRDYQRHKYVSSWWLTHLCSESGDSILLTYDEVRALHDSPTTYGYSQRNSFTEENQDIILSSEYNDPYERRDTTYHKILRTIESPLCKVVFSYKEPSPLTYQYPQLETISIYSKTDLSTPIESFLFHYSHNSDRAFLTQILHYGKDNKTQRYVFSYDLNHGIDPHKNQRDHWGYYSPHSTGRFPLRCSSFDQPIAMSNSLYTERFADNSTATNCMLTSIIYPSGVEAKLTWEPHDFSTLSFIGRHALHEENYSNVLSETLHQTSSSFLCGKQQASKLEESFAISEPTTLVIDMTHYYETAKNANSSYHMCVMEWNAVGDLYNRAYVELWKNGISQRRFYLSEHTNSRQTLDLSPGSYTIRLIQPTDMLREDGAACQDYWEHFNYSGIDEWPDGYVHLSLNRSIFNSSPFQARNVGGVRIKQIQYVSNNKSLLTKQYDYVKNDGVTSSGVLAFPPRYYSYNYVYESKGVFSGSGASMNKTSGSRCLTLRSNGLPYALNGGSHIEYSRVVEQTVSNNVYMDRLIHFYSCGDVEENSDVIDFDTHQLSAIPSSMMQLTSRNYMRGTEYLTKVFKDEELRREQEYEVIENDNTFSFPASIYPFADYSKTSLFYSSNYIKPYKNFGLTHYRIIPYNKRLKRSSVIGSRSGLSEDLYFYNNNTYSTSLNANLPIRHQSVTSEGDTLTEYYSYLPNSGKIQSCVTTRHSPSNSMKRVINAYRIVYDSFKHPIEKWVANLVQDSPIEYWDNVESLTTELVESCMYFHNRIVQKVDHYKSLSTVVLWSYANSYPIAEIENATWEQVTAYVGLPNIQRLFDSLEPDFSVLEELRAALPQSRIRTYQYIPLIGVSCSTDENGLSTFYSYDGFGNLSEVYYFKNGQKIILGHQDYQWSNH